MAPRSHAPPCGVVHAAALAALLAACGGGGAPAEVPAPETPARRAGALSVASGSGQLGRPGRTLLQPLVVTVLDPSGVATAGFDVSFIVSSGGGSVSPARATTDAQGLARTTLTLGAAGLQVVVARVAGTTGTLAVPLLATAVAGGAVAPAITVRRGATPVVSGKVTATVTYTATIPTQAGMTYLWGIEGGAFDPGATTTSSGTPGSGGTTSAVTFAVPAFDPFVATSQRVRLLVTEIDPIGPSSTSTQPALTAFPTPATPPAPVLTPASTDVTADDTFTASSAPRPGMTHALTLVNLFDLSGGLFQAGLAHLDGTPGVGTLEVREVNGAGDASAPSVTQLAIYPRPAAPSVALTRGGLPAGLALTEGVLYAAGVTPRPGMTYAWGAEGAALDTAAGAATTFHVDGPLARPQAVRLTAVEANALARAAATDLDLAAYPAPRTETIVAGDGAPLDGLAVTAGQALGAKVPARAGITCAWSVDPASTAAADLSGALGAPAVAVTPLGFSPDAISPTRALVLRLSETNAPADGGAASSVATLTVHPAPAGLGAIAIAAPDGSPRASGVTGGDAYRASVASARPTMAIRWTAVSGSCFPPACTAVVTCGAGPSPSACVAPNAVALTAGSPPDALVVTAAELNALGDAGPASASTAQPVLLPPSISSFTLDGVATTAHVAYGATGTLRATYAGGTAQVSGQGAPFAIASGAPRATAPITGATTFVLAVSNGVDGLALRVASAAVAPWTPVGPPGFAVRRLRASPADPALAAALTDAGGALVTRDGGASWQVLIGPDAPARAWDATWLDGATLLLAGESPLSGDPALWLWTAVPPPAPSAGPLSAQAAGLPAGQPIRAVATLGANLFATTAGGAFAANVGASPNFVWSAAGTLGAGPWDHLASNGATFRAASAAGDVAEWRVGLGDWAPVAAGAAAGLGAAGLAGDAHGRWWAAFAGGPGAGVYLDAGAGWTASLPGGTAVAFDAAGDALLAATGAAGTLQSLSPAADLVAATWAPAGATLGLPATALAGALSATLLAGTADGARASGDGGATLHPAPALAAHRVTALGAGPGTLYAAAEDVRLLHRSLDAGITWTRLGPAAPALPPSPVLQLQAGPSPGQVAARTAAGDLLASQDGGASWAPVALGGALLDLAADPVTGRQWAVTDAPALLSSDDLSTWRAVAGLGAPGAPVRVTARGGDVVALLLDGPTPHLVRSLAPGDPFGPVGVPPIPLAAAASGLAHDPWTGSLWIHSGGRVARSPDGGASWEERSTGLPGAPLVAFLPAFGEVWAATSQELRRLSGGAWAAPAHGPTAPLTSLAPSAATATTVFVGTEGTSVEVTSSGGE